MVVALALIAGGCGGSSSTRTSTSASSDTGASSDTSTSTSTSTGTGTAATSGATSTRPAGNVVPAGSVALVAGTPITQTMFDHWMHIAATSEASQKPGELVIVPDPPAYTKCIAQARKRLPALKHASKQTLEADCRQLYESLSSQVMDFLIKADWIQSDASRLGLLPSAAQVNDTFTKDKSTRFPGGKGYEAFLAKTGQTDDDVRYRVRITVIFGRLTAREKGSAAAKATTVTKREKRLFGAQTRCTPLVLMTDCANYRAG